MTRTSVQIFKTAKLTFSKALHVFFEAIAVVTIVSIKVMHLERLHHPHPLHHLYHLHHLHDQKKLKSTKPDVRQYVLMAAGGVLLGYGFYR